MLEVKNLKTHFFTEEGVVKAVDGISFEVFPGEILGIVGESGAGKTVTALSILRLLPPSGKTVRGEVLFKGKDLFKLKEAEMRRVRGKEIALIFQDPFASLNPALTIGSQIGETIALHQQVRGKEAFLRAVQILEKVGFPRGRERMSSYPHQFSGGMRQRVMIGIALSGEPDLLIADEPTTALDVTIEAQILELISKIREEKGMSLILITHNLGLIARVAEKVLVLHKGRMVEYGPVEEIFSKPKHSYTQELIEAIR